MGDKSLLDMREDDEWVLDSMYSDPSKIRSKLAFDVWNEFESVSTYNNFSRSEYVDLYINQEYIGLYLLKEPIDEKTLGLKETTTNDSGILIKGINYVSFDKENYDLNKKGSIVSPYEIKYPNNMNDYSEYWDYVINDLRNSDVSTQYLCDKYDINNYIDYKLLINVVVAFDNYASKNKYISLENMSGHSKFILTPWDLDQTFGLYWSGELPTLLVEDMENYKSEWLTQIFVNDDIELINLIKQRYFKLRETVLDVASINKKIDLYYEQIKYSAYRDSKIWIESDVETEISKVKTWYKNRIEFLDKYIGDYDV